MSRLAVVALALMLGASGSVRAQGTQDALLRWGALATLTPLCGLRDEAWAFDLRRAELQAATKSERSDDEALRRAPGRAEAEAALSYAETEALEQFADAPPERSCVPLARDPALGEADEIVRAFRWQRDPRTGS